MQVSPSQGVPRLQAWEEGGFARQEMPSDATADIAHMAYPVGLGKTLPGERVRDLFLVWVKYLGVTLEGEPWLPVGACGPVLLLGHHDPRVPIPLPGYVVQPIKLGREDYARLRADSLHWCGEVIATKFVDPVDVRPPNETDLISPNAALRFLMNHAFNERYALDRIESLVGKREWELAELPPGYASATLFIADGVLIGDLEMFTTDSETVGMLSPDFIEERRCVVFNRLADQMLVAAESKDPSELRDHIEAVIIMGGDARELKEMRFVYVENRAIKLFAKRAGAFASRRVTSIETGGRVAGGVTQQEVALSLFRSDYDRIDPERAGTPMEDVRDWLLYYAATAGVSDVHIEAAFGQGRVRFRTDGDLKTVYQSSLDNLRSLISVTKNAIGMQPTHFDAQDRSFAIRVDNDTLRMRCSAAPTRYGLQSLVMRLLPKKPPVDSIYELDLMPDELEQLQRNITEPQGLFVVSGPTGSGKTTTLMACLQEINNPSSHILTFEDPVEYELEGVNQCEVDRSRGIDFARLMRAALRQDPDVILLGEARDQESAMLAVEASLTGHLVFTTTHTVSAAKTIERFEMLKIPPDLLAQSLVMLLAQRLVKALNPSRRVGVPVTPAMLEVFCAKGIPFKGEVVYEPHMDARGDPIYEGRFPIMEIVPLDEEMRATINAGKGSQMIRPLAQKQGYRSLYQNALLKVAQGKTPWSESQKWQRFG